MTGILAKPMKNGRNPTDTITCCLLIIIVISNLILPQFANHWNLTLPRHTHLFIGPLQPDWLDHPHTHSHALSEENNLAQFAQKGIISIYSLPASDNFLLSVGVPFVLPDHAGLLRPSAEFIHKIIIATSLPSEIFLPLLDKPPTSPLL
ncbi:MAG TPA: hypothetical protein EYH05_04195 [Anaerolineae bacterium]|nr:hypothetical protein [Anaerolineae bacterium]